jgi:hypothetical protein
MKIAFVFLKLKVINILAAFLKQGRQNPLPKVIHSLRYLPFVCVFPYIGCTPGKKNGSLRLVTEQKDDNEKITNPYFICNNSRCRCATEF